jgi:hypothetical protein
MRERRGGGMEKGREEGRVKEREEERQEFFKWGLQQFKGKIYKNLFTISHRKANRKLLYN